MIRKRIVTLSIFIILLPISLCAQDYKHEISLSYGFMPASSIYDVLSNDFGSKPETHLGDEIMLGPLSLEYYYHLSPIWSVGVTGVYSRLEYNLYEKNAVYNKWANHATLLVGAKAHWIRGNVFKMYSKAAIGATYSIVNQHMKVPALLPNFQLSLLGFNVMFCPQLGMFAELGIGEQGILHGGINLYL